MIPFRIIYLDDEPHLCEMFVDNFSSAEVSIQAFTDPEKAVAAINTSNPDLVFLDYRLPETTGEEVAIRLPPSIPKVLLTGDLSLEASANFTRLFFKPFSFVEVEEFIQIYIDRKSGSVNRG